MEHIEHKLMICKQINELCKLVFEDETLEIDFNSNANNVRGWDSMTNLFLIDELERKFNVKFSIDDIYSANCIGDLIDIIMKAK